MKHEKHRRILLFGIVLASLLIAAILLLEYIFGISGILARPVLRIGLEFAFLVALFTPPPACPSHRTQSVGHLPLAGSPLWGWASVLPGRDRVSCEAALD